MVGNFIKAKLLITVVEEHYARLVIEAIKKAGATGGTRTSGRGNAFYRVPGGLPAAEAPEDIIFSVIMNDAEGIFQAVARMADDSTEPLGGMILLIDVPSMFQREGSVCEANTSLWEEKGKKAMESGITLITSIINHGEADDIMTVARNAGARGGTIVNARGTGTAEDIKFFGISLAPEKEMLFIVADNECCAAIVDAMSSLPLFSEPGGGIIFTVAVEEFIIMGNN